MIQIQGKMGVNSPESDFDLNSSFLPINISDFLKDLYTTNDVSEKIMKVNDYVRELEDELRKIHAFKRELPFCVLLLNDAIERLKEEKMNCTDAKGRPLTEEFMPLKGGNSNEDRGAKKSSDWSEKKNWMNSVQLWSTNVEYENLDVKIQGSVSDLKSRVKEEDGYGSAAGNPYDQICSKLKNNGGAFVPFKRHSDLIFEKQKNKLLAINDLSLSVPRADMGSMNMKGNITKTTSGSSLRKPRRCWSLELHRRFVSALQQLGGPQVATPKEIREIMQVGDLTNDEVKSHLQKYRLHVQKIPASSAAPSNCSRLGGGQYGNTSNKPCISHSGSPEGPLHMDTTAKGTSTSVEGGEDEKSEGRNWKCQLQKPDVSGPRCID